MPSFGIKHARYAFPEGVSGFKIGENPSLGVNHIRQDPEYSAISLNCQISLKPGIAASSGASRVEVEEAGQMIPRQVGRKLDRGWGG